MSDKPDKVWVFGTEYSRREVAELERFAGKSTLVGDLIRFGDACRAFGEAFMAPFHDLARKLRR